MTRLCITSVHALEYTLLMMECMKVVLLQLSTLVVRVPSPSRMRHLVISSSRGWVHMFLVRLHCLNDKSGPLRQASISTAGGTHGITGRTCLKSLPRSQMFQPNGCATHVISRKHLSIACSAQDGITEASSKA